MQMARDTRNLPNEMVSAWFKKGNSHLIRYSSDGHSNQLDYILYHKIFNGAVQNLKVILKEECIKQCPPVVCDFTTHIPHRRKWKLSPYNHTPKLRKPATASSSWPSRKNLWLLGLQLQPLLVQLLILQNMLSLLDQSWRVLCWKQPPKSMISSGTVSRNLKSGGEMKSCKMMCKRICLKQCQACGKTCYLAGNVWVGERRIRHSISIWW